MKERGQAIPQVIKRCWFFFKISYFEISQDSDAESPVVELRQAKRGTNWYTVVLFREVYFCFFPFLIRNFFSDLCPGHGAAPSSAARLVRFSRLLDPVGATTRPSVRSRFTRVRYHKNSNSKWELKRPSEITEMMT